MRVTRHNGAQPAPQSTVTVTINNCISIIVLSDGSSAPSGGSVYQRCSNSLPAWHIPASPVLLSSGQTVTLDTAGSHHNTDLGVHADCCRLLQTCRPVSATPGQPEGKWINLFCCETKHDSYKLKISWSWLGVTVRACRLRWVGLGGLSQPWYLYTVYSQNIYRGADDKLHS